MNTDLKQSPPQSDAGARPAELPVHPKQALHREQPTYPGAFYEPQVDIHETDEALVVCADLPGVKPEDVETDLRDNVLTLTARTRPVESRWRPAHEEYGVGHFLRQFRLGQQIDQARITAQLKDGVLTLTLPKADHARPRRIAVQAG